MTIYPSHGLHTHINVHTNTYTRTQACTRACTQVVYVDEDDNIIGEEDEDEDVTDGPAFSLTIGEEGTVSVVCQEPLVWCKI